MEFFRKFNYGRELFYPIGKLSTKFIDAFPGSSGKRKCLTIYQKEILEELGIPCRIKKTLPTTKKGDQHVDGRNGRLRSVPKTKMQSKDRHECIEKTGKINKGKKFAGQ